MNRDIRAEVIAAQFRYGTTAEPLRIRAFGQVIAKALFLAGPKNYLSLEGIRGEVEDLTAGARPSRGDVEAALGLLDARGVLRRRGRKFGLKDAARKKLDEQLNARHRRIVSILERHFPQTQDQDAMASWLDQMCVAFFIRHSEKWVASLTRGATLPPPTDEHLISEAMVISDQLSLSASPEQLLKGFEKFIKSENPEDNQHLWSVGVAAFAARLVAAGTGGDPISVRELQGRVFLMDTNVLIAITLEKERWAPSFAALGRALNALGITLGYTYQTLTEYQGVIDGWNEDTMYALERRGPDVVLNASDQYIRLAVSRNCYVAADYAVFFDEMRRAPEDLDGQIGIELLDTPEIAQAAEQGVSDEKRIIQIQNFWAERRRRPKRRAAAVHDSAVTAVAQELSRSGTETSVLTLDGTMHELALQWSRPLGEPLWISLDALIQVLALDSAGPGVDATDFAPLLTALISHDFEMSMDEYHIEDLKWLDEIEQDVQDLPPKEVQDLAREVHRLRLGGKGRRDPELRLSLQRAYQRAKSSLAGDVAEARRREATAHKEAEAERRRGDEVRDAFVREKMRQIRRWRRARWGGEAALWVLLAGVLAIAGIGVLELAVTPGDMQGVIEVGAVVATPALAALGLIFKRVLPRYRKEMITLRERAEREVEGTLSSGGG